MPQDEALDLAATTLPLVENKCKFSLIKKLPLKGGKRLFKGME